MKVTNRDTAHKVIEEQLFGLLDNQNGTELLHELIHSLGTSAFTDEALIKLAD